MATIKSAMKTVASSSGADIMKRSGVITHSQATERVITSEQLNRMTPTGTPITASREEVLSVLSRSANSIKTQHALIIEAAGGIRTKI
ncbi:hypothetical protein [Kosakonia oryziphila]|uniref:hypothetical protein n=1 Tax=Kosakonia oryziphila TaxID=1005667 RepID=UPI000B7CD80A|nr:hypothetical protein [Kosakonia oryziphila]